MSGYTGTQAELLYSLPAAVTNTAFTAQRVVSSPTAGTHCIVPSGFFQNPPASGPGKALLIKGYGTMANQATAATFANVLAFDVTQGTLAAGGTIFSLPAITPTASTVVPWEFEIMVTCQQTGFSQTTLQCNGMWRHSIAATSTIPVATNLASHVAVNLTGLNSEAQMFVEMFSTCSASGTSAIVVQQLLMFGLN